MQIRVEIVRFGHRRIAYLSLPDDLIATSLRPVGFHAAHTEAGLVFERALVQIADVLGRAQNTERLEQANEYLLTLEAPPTVLCCGNDKLAMQAYEGLRSRGVDVSDQMSVAGYDSCRLIAESLFPALTTFQLPSQEIGVAAGRRLLALFSKEATGPEQPMLVSSPVHWRSSVCQRTSEIPTSTNREERAFETDICWRHHRLRRRLERRLRANRIVAWYHGASYEAEAALLNSAVEEFNTSQGDCTVIVANFP